MSSSPVRRAIVIAIGTAIVASVGACSDADGRTSTVGAPSTTASAAMATATRLSGRYAHYDVVAYQSTDMKTLIISYGFTDLGVKDGKLMAQESFCHADHASDQPIKTTISDAATSAIKPIAVAVTLTDENGRPRLQRPETPTGIGIHLENPATDVLPTDPNDPRIADDDNDGKPGITVKIEVTDDFGGELYIARRERFAYDVTEQDDASLSGTVTDRSEQLILGASDPAFITRAEWVQLPDLSKSPIVLKKVTPDWDCTRLVSERDALFPLAPTVDW